MRRDQSVGCRRSRNHPSARQSGGKARTQHDLNGFSYPLPLLGDVYNLFVVRCSETFLLELTRRVDP